MRTKMAGGGDSVDYDALTASQDDVVEGRVFLGSGSDETQRGNLTDREIKTQATPGVSSGMSETPLYDADSVQLTNDTTGRRTIAIAPPRGRYPGGNKAYVRVGPEEIGVTPDVIAVGHIAAGVTGDYGSDGTATANDIKAGKVAYTREGRVVGAVKDYGSINKTIKDGETYDIQRGIYAEGKITAKAVTLSVSGRTVKASNGKEASVNFAGSNGVVSLSTTGGTGNQAFDITDGYATQVNVDRTGAYNAGYDAGNKAGYSDGYSAGLNAFSKYPTVTAYRGGDYITAKMVPVSQATTVQKSIGTPCYVHSGMCNDGYQWTDSNGDGTTYYVRSCAKCSLTETSNSRSRSEEAVKRSHYSTVPYGSVVGYLLT